MNQASQSIQGFDGWHERQRETEAALMGLGEAEAALSDLAGIFLEHTSDTFPSDSASRAEPEASSDEGPNAEARYRALVEQVPAVIFMAYLDRGIGEAYVSPQIEAALGFSQHEWLEDPIRWYQQIHPADKQRWSIEAAELFVSGRPLRSAYRVIARDGRVVWFHCEAKMIRRPDGRPWFVHGIAIDVTELKRAEESLREERNVVSAILNTVGALVVVLDRDGRIVRFNRACEEATGYSFAEVRDRYVWDLFMVPEDLERFQAIFSHLQSGELPGDYESHWVNRLGHRRLIAWSSTILPGEDGQVTHIIATGIDVTERKRLENAILDISAREQRRIGQDLHDGLGQHLTGIAFLSKALEQKLAEKSLAEASDAAKIVKLVNEAIHNTRELARGLLPVVSEAHGLMSALEQWANEVEDLYGISCWFQSSEPVLIDDGIRATHLYHIAQEAVNNAIKHGQARHIVIRLGVLNGAGTLTVQDDGSGFPERLADRPGMGLHIMNYRARMIGGSLEVQRSPDRGTLVSCIFPIHRPDGSVGSP